MFDSRLDEREPESLGHRWEEVGVVRVYTGDRVVFVLVHDYDDGGILPWVFVRK